jgi:hypothetical protein
VLVGEEDDRILGFTMVGAEAGEVVAVVQTAMLAGLSGMPSSHPTMGRGSRPAFVEPAVPLTGQLFEECRDDWRSLLRGVP